MAKETGGERGEVGGEEGEEEEGERKRDGMCRVVKAAGNLTEISSSMTANL